MEPVGVPEDPSPPPAQRHTRGEGIATPVPETQRMPPWIPRLLLLIVLTIFAAYAGFSLFRRLQGLFVWLVAALFLSFALEPAVNWVARRGWRRGAATALVLFGFALILIVMVAAMVPLVIDQVQELVARAPTWLDQASVYSERWFGIELTGEKILNAIASAQADVSNLASNIASIGTFLLSLVFQVLTIGLFTFYLVADGPRFRRAVCSVLTPRRQREVLAAWNIAVDKTGGYLYSRLLLAIVNALVTFVVLTALGIPFAVPLALWQGFVSQFIPVVGTYIAAAIPLLVALLEDPVAALVFLIFVVVYQQIENYVLAPRITARTMQLHPAVAFFAVLAGGSISGLLGAFMALPAAAVIQATISGYLTRHEVVESELTRATESPPGDLAASRRGTPRGVVARVSARLRRSDGRSSRP